MNPSQDRREFVTTAAAGTEAVFNRFSKWCAAETGCALHGKDVAAVFRQAQHNADTGHIQGKDLMGRPWSAASVTQYTEVTTNNSFNNAGEGLLKLSQGRNPLPRRREWRRAGSTGDFPIRRPACLLRLPDVVLNFDQARGDRDAGRKAAPVTGYSTNASQYTSICLAGPHPADNSSHPVTSRSTNPTMLLSNTHDASTPVTWSEKVASQLGMKAVHVVTDQVGHGGGMRIPETLHKVTAYMNRFNPVPAA
ncbi:alpha/beta hydrolase [Streptomyces sp. 4.24]|uniref:alpha/beta hydrolase n=1 Tax=Streptomyces tritrimontium TaxID=3406573 RepID=UPI003BB76A95